LLPLGLRSTKTIKAAINLIKMKSMIKNFESALAHFPLFSSYKVVHPTFRAFCLTLTMPVKAESGHYETEEFWGAPVRRLVEGDTSLLDSVPAADFECYIWHEASGFEFEVSNDNWADRPAFLACLDPLIAAVKAGQNIDQFALLEALAGLYGGCKAKAENALDNALELI